MEHLFQFYYDRNGENVNYINVQFWGQYMQFFLLQRTEISIIGGGKKKFLTTGVSPYPVPHPGAELQIEDLAVIDLRRLKNGTEKALVNIINR